MTKKKWNELRIIIENGDPIKDICDEDDLIQYILDLRARFGVKDDEP